MEVTNVMIAFGMTLLAGLSTGIGSVIALAKKKHTNKFLAFMLGLSAGVMIYISFVELFNEAKINLILNFGDKIGTIYAIFAFFLGMIIVILIDKFVPHNEKELNPNDNMDLESDLTLEPDLNDQDELDKIDNYEEQKQTKGKVNMLRTSIVTTLAITIHNFPEGMATFISALSDPKIAIPIVIAIGLHNIPEGLTVSILVNEATGSRKMAFIWSVLSGLTEFFGALFVYLILGIHFSTTMLSLILAAVAGIMVYISFDELLPSAYEYGDHKLVNIGLLLGMIVMAISLVMFI